jgi:radical SAM superfamily enzyme YgiQ (UPF0313 family)
MKSPYDIVLLSPPSRAFNHYRPPMALIFLAGYLKHHHLSCKIIDIVEKSSIHDQNFLDHVNDYRQLIEAEIIEKVKKYPSGIYGITCYTPEYFEVLSLANKIKSIYPKAKIIVGGIHPTLYPDELLREPNTPIDFEVIGEGEVTLWKLLLAIKSKKKNFSQVEGIAYLNQSTGKIVKTPFRPLEDNLDLISYTDYDQLDVDYYTNASPYSIRGCFLRSIYLLATRGCPSACTFCVAKKLRSFNGGGKYTRVRSAQNLISEIKHLHHRFHIDSFYFIDDLFTINHDNVIEFCRLLKKAKLHLLWGCSSKVSTLNQNLLKIMAASGCIQIDFGVERGSNKALKLVQKGITVEMVKEIFQLCHHYHIRTFANFLVNLPGETKKDLNDIITLASDLKPDVFTANVFIPYPGTEIYDQSPFHFSKSEYPLLTYADALFKKAPHKFRFSRHRIDILSWANSQNHRFNHFLPTLLFHLSPRYLFTILLSKRKLNYLSQFSLLIREYLNQKFVL